MTTEQNQMITITTLKNVDEIKICARMMANSEPWITLGRDYKASVQTLSDTSKEIYVACVTGEIVGFIIINMKGAFVGYIQTICVSPVQRGNGIGSALLQFAENRIFTETANVFMCVSSFNGNAQKLYQRLGYEVVGELKDYIVSGHSEMLLRKTIASLNDFMKEDARDIRIVQEHIQEAESKPSIMRPIVELRVALETTGAI